MKSLKDYADDPGICEYLETLIFRPQLLDYFETLRREAHHLYALLMQAPPSVVWIDWANCHAPWQSESYSVAAFCAAPEEAFPFPEELYLFVAGYIPRSERDQASELKYEPFSGRCVRLFSKRDELTVEALLNEFPAMLLLQGREALLDGHPLLPDDATVRR
ncbi:hypothetical protein, partial [Alistipes sp.]|uniref:hypothetical protein n=1 Tax=Alistipes sp. TaxID=1872444 RepID=UPI003AF1DCBB